MKNIVSRLLIAIVVIVVSVAAQAQNSTILRADVPFDFMIGQHQLTSGTYTVRSIASEIDAWYNGQGQSLFVMRTIPAGKMDSANTCKLVFHRYGDEYFLSELWSQGSSHEVPVTKREKRLAQLQPSETIALVLQPQ